VQELNKTYKGPCIS